MYNEIDIPNSYTMEASFYGPSSKEAFGNEPCDDMHMNEIHLASIGKSLCKIFPIFFSQRLFYSKVIFSNKYLQGKKEIISTNQDENVKSVEDNIERIEDISVRKLEEEKNNETDKDASHFEEETDNKFDNSEQILGNSMWDEIVLEESNDVSDDSGGSESNPEERLINIKDKRSKSNLKPKKLISFRNLNKKSEDLEKPEIIKSGFKSEGKIRYASKNKLELPIKKQDSKKKAWCL